MTSTPVHTPTSSTTGLVTGTFDVAGMTCDHCVRAVTSEIQQIANVTDVCVDVATGKVVVTSDEPIYIAAVAAAVDQAGYQLIGAAPYRPVTSPARSRVAR
jgi:copper chaperone CopZ